MVTTLCLVRHGETEGSDTRRYKGSMDVPLSEKGLEQMKRTSLYVSGLLYGLAAARDSGYLKAVHGTGGEDGAPESGPSVIRAIYSSDLIRAVKSAEVLAGFFSLPIVSLVDLRERNFGVWEGMTFTEIKERYHREFEAWADNPVRFSPPGGESTEAVRDRTMKALNGILDRHQGETVAVVAHGGVNRVILAEVMGMPLEHIFRIEQDYAAVNIIEYWDRYPVVKLLNGRPLART